MCVGLGDLMLAVCLCVLCLTAERLVPARLGGRQDGRVSVHLVALMGPCVVLACWVRMPATDW